MAPFKCHSHASSPVSGRHENAITRRLAIHVAHAPSSRARIGELSRLGDLHLLLLNHRESYKRHGDLSI